MKVKIESLHSSLLSSARIVYTDSDPNPDPYGNQSPWNQWNKQGFRAWFSRARRAENQPECLPTTYKPQLITRRSLVQVQPPQPNKKGTREGAFLFGSNWLPMEASRLRAGRPLRSNVVGTCGSPTNAPSLAAKKGERSRESSMLRSLTQNPMKPWFHRFFLFVRNRF